MSKDSVKIDENIKECNGFFSAQSTKASDGSRFVSCAIIGTIWAVCFNSEQGFSMPDCWLRIALILSACFFCVDLCHYVLDSVHYFIRMHKLQNAKLKGADKMHEENKRYEVVMPKFSKVSMAFLFGKITLCLVSSICFIIGLLVL